MPHPEEPVKNTKTFAIGYVSESYQVGRVTRANII